MIRPSTTVQHVDMHCNISKWPRSVVERESFFWNIRCFIFLTLPETDSSLPLKIGHPKRKRSSSNHPFSGANLLLVSGRVLRFCVLGRHSSKKELMKSGVSITFKIWEFLQPFFLHPPAPSSRGADGSVRCQIHHPLGSSIGTPFQLEGAGWHFFSIL